MKLFFSVLNQTQSFPFLNPIHYNMGRYVMYRPESHCSSVGLLTVIRYCNFLPIANAHLTALPHIFHSLLARYFKKNFFCNVYLLLRERKRERERDRETEERVGEGQKEGDTESEAGSRL